MHGGAGVFDEEAKHRHEVIITVIYYLYPNWSHFCNNLCLLLYLFDKFLKD
jgi:hypothetical protein